MRTIALVVGVISVSLGGLWLLQGLGVVHIRPILCFVDCASVQEPSRKWAIIGSFVVAVGAFVIFYSRLRRTSQ